MLEFHKTSAGRHTADYSVHLSGEKIGDLIRKQDHKWVYHDRNGTSVVHTGGFFDVTRKLRDALRLSLTNK